MDKTGLKPEMNPVVWFIDIDELEKLCNDTLEALTNLFTDPRLFSKKYYSVEKMSIDIANENEIHPKVLKQWKKLQSDFNKKTGLKLDLLYYDPEQWDYSLTNKKKIIAKAAAYFHVKGVCEITEDGYGLTANGKKYRNYLFFLQLAE